MKSVDILFSKLCKFSFFKMGILFLLTLRRGARVMLVKAADGGVVVDVAIMARSPETVIQDEVDSQVHGAQSVVHLVHAARLQRSYERDLVRRG